MAFYLQVQLATDTDKTSKRRKLEPETGQSSMTKLKLMMAALAAILFCGTQAKADTVVLTFEGAGNQNTIGNFYNGGAGGNLGIQFGADSLIADFFVGRRQRKLFQRAFRRDHRIFSFRRGRHHERRGGIRHRFFIFLHGGL